MKQRWFMLAILVAPALVAGFPASTEAAGLPPGTPELPEYFRPIAP